MVVFRPAVRLEVDVAPSERVGVAELAPVVPVDREADAAGLVAADECLAVAAAEAVREAHLHAHPRHRRKAPRAKPSDVLEPEQVVLLVADRAPDPRRGEEGHVGQAEASS